MTEPVKKTMNEAMRKVLKRLHYPFEVMLMCVRWYAAYPLSLRQLEEMMLILSGNPGSLALG